MLMTMYDLISMFFSLALIVISLIFLERLFFAKKYFRLPKKYDNYLSFEELPTVSICVPARNEKHTIELCLEAILASDYPKMEVIVLDDDSVDNTSEAVKRFAQRGVRFIKGDKLPRGWIGKNHALAQLSEQATGSYIVFMGADTMIGVTDISTLIRYALERNLSMISVMPKRAKLKANVFFGSLRFFWELILHSRNFPAISTSIWLVKTDELEGYGNFWQNHQATIRPESSLASYFYGKHKYRFLVANQFLQVAHEKDWFSQLMTSIRTSGPVFDKSIWLKTNVVMVLMLTVVGSCLCLVNLLCSQSLWLRLLSGATLAMLSLMSVCYTRLSWSRGWILGLVSWPWAFLQELCLLLLSIIYSKFNIISWKGRRLPKIKDADCC